MPTPDWITAAPQAACLVVCAVAVVTDLRSLRIPNWLTYPAFGAALALHFGVATEVAGPGAGVTRGLLPALGWSLGVLLVTLPAALRGLLGMGDAKLLAVVAAFLPGLLAVRALLYTAVCGGLLALWVALRRQRLGESLRNVARGSLRAEQERARQLPYGVAIACGTLWAVVVHGGWLGHLP